jgi:uncharacterized phage infection (PIP) family protein YhgE
LKSDRGKVYNVGMGMLGILIALGITVLMTGYYYFGMSSSSISITNDASAPQTTGLALYEDWREQAIEIKETEEERVEKEIAALEEVLNNEQAAKNDQPDPQDDGAKEPPAAERIALTDRLMSSGFAVPSKTRTIDTIVLHSSYNPNDGEAYSVAELVQIYESYGVSAHYLIDRAGTIYRLVEDKNIAYHAGASKMPDGRRNVNDFSIGIEMMNKEDTEYTKEQYAAVNALVAWLKKQHGIKYIVGHNNVAPDRKTDPWNFDWKKLD